MKPMIALLGRQPALGLAELESLYGAANITPFCSDAALVDAPVDFARLGGTIKLGRVLEIANTNKWYDIERRLKQHSLTIAAAMPDGKIQLGLSVYGASTSPQQIVATGLSLKQALRQAGHSVRLIPNKTPALSSAQVLHNHLTGPTGCELVVVQAGSHAVLARIESAQDITDYTRRDRGRPKRDSRVGMLPPKLAQIIINLALAGRDPANMSLLDPFCGTGVVLQEAALMGCTVYGTDLEPRMISYTHNNLTWLDDTYQRNTPATIEIGDATSHRWATPFDTVATETYLGRPFTSRPTAAVLEQTVSEVNTILKKFLRNLQEQVPAGTRLCLAVPAWQTAPGTFRHVPLIDQLGEIGYNRLSFEHVRDDRLLYYRTDQIVARELLVITRK